MGFKTGPDGEPHRLVYGFYLVRIPAILRGHPQRCDRLERAVVLAPDRCGILNRLALQITAELYPKLPDRFRLTRFMAERLANGIRPSLYIDRLTCARSQIVREQPV